MESIDGKVGKIETNTSEKEGTTGTPTKTYKRKVIIEGIGDSKGLTIEIRGKPTQLEGFIATEQLRITISNPQTRLTE
jgi:hypothetical protein